MPNPFLSLQEVCKTYGSFKAVDQLNIEISEGSIFGLVGPNGAGKSTTIRMIMNIIWPDFGSIHMQGQRMHADLVRSIGYLPEERGLYRKMTVDDVLIFLGRLKGLSKSDARGRIALLLDQFDLTPWRHKKCETLSKGMQQKIQFISTILHNPRLIILDEPFSGLDPVGMALLRDIILELRAQGTTIIFSSHQMDQIEKLCDEICMLNQGKRILYGNLHEVKRGFGKQNVEIQFEGNGSFLKSLPEVKNMEDFGRYVELTLHDINQAQTVLRRASDQLKIWKFQVVEPSLNDIFVKLVETQREPRTEINP